MKTLSFWAALLVSVVGAQASESRQGDLLNELPRNWVGEHFAPGVRMPMKLEITALTRAAGPNRTPGFTMLDAQGAVTIANEVYPLRQVRVLQAAVRDGIYEVYFMLEHPAAQSLFGQVKREADGSWKAQGYPQNGWRPWGLTAQ